MYKELKKLRKYTENLDDAIHNMYSYTQSSEIELTNEDISNIGKLSNKLKKKDVYILLEAIYSSSSTFNDSLVKELEEKFTYLVYKWADAYKKYQAEAYEVDSNLYFWIEVVNEQLIKSINGINRFCINYLSMPKSCIFSGLDNLVIGIAHKAYLKAKQRYYELQYYGVKALTKEDHFNIMMLGIDNPEQYVEYLISEGIEFDKSEYDFESDNEVKLDEIIKQDDFQVCFVSECKIRRKTDTHSDLKRTGILGQSGHPFCFKTDTHSGAKRTPVLF